MVTFTFGARGLRGFFSTTFLGSSIFTGSSIFSGSESLGGSIGKCTIGCILGETRDGLWGNKAAKISANKASGTLSGSTLYRLYSTRLTAAVIASLIA